ncbi:MAG TPA: hypothetical protein VJN43_06330 [Bryobacteraceae bacterium]|nr:hypothetical protein [Bryobacteraceae bacterium]
MYDFKSKPLHITGEPVTGEPKSTTYKKAPWIGAIAAVTALTALAGLGVYVHSAFERSGSAFIQPLKTLSARVDASDAKAQFWTRRQQELEGQVASLNKQVESRYYAARKLARTLSDQVYQRVHQEIAAEAQALDGRLALVESKSATEEARTNQLEQQLASLHEETAQQAAKLKSAEEQIEKSAAVRDQQIAGLHDRLISQAEDFNALAAKLAVRRVDFEVTKNHTGELADGVSLSVTGTDTGYRRVSGWIWLMPDRRTIWLRDQAAQEPVVFYGYPDGKRRELVITNVAKDSVTGFLLVPADISSGLNAALTAAAESNR